MGNWVSFQGDKLPDTLAERKRSVLLLAIKKLVLMTENLMANMVRVAKCLNRRYPARQILYQSLYLMNVFVD